MGSEVASEVESNVELLFGLVGSWSGTARIAWPGRDPFELTHTESVRLVAGGTILTIEGNSYRSGVQDPVFSAFAVAYDGEAGPQWHAFRGGGSLQVDLELAPGRFAWSVPDPSGTVDYVAEFDDGQWSERGTMIIAGQQQEVFAMRLTRSA